MRLPVCLAIAVSVVGSCTLAGRGVEQPSPPTADWYAQHLFLGDFGCVTGLTEKRLQPDQALLLFRPDAPPMSATVDAVRDKGGPWPIRDSRRDCDRTFRHADYTWAATLATPQGRADGAFIAVDPDAARFAGLGGQHTRLVAKDTQQLRRSVKRALPAAYRGDVLAHAYRYGAGADHEAIELYLGVPTRNSVGQDPPIKSIKICRLYFVDGRLLAQQEYSRESGVEERVDSGIIELTPETWSVSDSESTIGFISHDGGATWIRLSVNVGFEGVWWRAQRLSPGLPDVLVSYMYTSH